MPEAPASPSLRGATNYAPVRPPRESSLPTRITKPAAPAGQPAHPAQPQAPVGRPSMPVPPPAAAAPRFFLEIEGRMHPVDRLPFVLGRGSDADLRLDDKGVSRRHLQLSMQGGAVVASDMGSTNGTLINGVPLRAPVMLANGSLLRMGNTRIIFHSSTGGAR